MIKSIKISYPRYNGSVKDHLNNSFLPFLIDTSKLFTNNPLYRIFKRQKLNQSKLRRNEIFKNSLRTKLAGNKNGGLNITL